MRAPSQVAAAVAVAGVVVFGATACADSSPGEAPLGTTQWQVSQIFDTADRANLLPDPQQGRAYIVFGEKDFTGASGCVHLQGKLEWTGDFQTMKVSEFRTEQFDDSTAAATAECAPGDEDTADRLRAVMEHQDLEVTRPSDNTLKLQQMLEDSQAWESRPAVEFISGPAD
ncbi:MAG TPA: hypothetical protein H9867_01690 [Candidatus Corynebacterium gallistercoris]|uniref:META domain-containing protein n=1 Tax=Candidatus Corynebacterium gallistercoris TaxID=2838530 RepID=A0A9D1UPA2_9CORY|nr:hypothetical protein [Candidatus Corynebacterium gallistercoris]